VATPTERRAARAHFGLPEEAPVAVVVAAMAPEKRVDVAIHAVGRLPDWRLLVVGGGPLADELARVADHQAPGRVVLTGSLTDVVPAYHAADVALLTSDTEGLPGVLVEAALCGLPAVSTDVGFVPDVVRDGVSGRLVGTADPVATATALKDCYAARGPMGAAARASALEQFELAQVVARWRSLLHQAVTSRH
jgi:glycosyltransferase involved in cell wall biosynthesis